MKKILYTSILLCLLPAAEIKAQVPDAAPLRTVNPEITRTDSTVCLSFSIQVDRRSLRSGMTVVLAPHITNGEYTVSFDPAVLETSQSRIYRKRRQRTAGVAAGYPKALLISQAKTVLYSAEIPFQQWMQGADILAETVAAGCCSTWSETQILARNVIPAPVQGPDPEPIIVEFPILTVADSLAAVFPFVLPAAEFDPENPIRFYDDERDNAITVYYPINRYDINPQFAGNQQTLNNLIATIEIIREDLETDVTHVVVAGFASPDGPFALNDRLAWERAVSVKQYIMQTSGLDDGLISVYNGSADWQGVRLFVSRDHRMPGRSEVLHILENTPVEHRMSAIRQLKSGAAYNYMAEHIFPQLRNGSFIRVFYDNTTK